MKKNTAIILTIIGGVLSLSKLFEPNIGFALSFNAESFGYNTFTLLCYGLLILGIFGLATQEQKKKDK